MMKLNEFYDYLNNGILNNNQVMCEVACNLDVEGSSTMYFNGKIINNPSNRNNSERSVSDNV